MGMDIVLQDHISAIAHADWQTSGLHCAYLATTSAAALTVKAAEHSLQASLDEAQRADLELVAQASRSRLAELQALAQRGLQQSTHLSCQELVFGGGTPLPEADRQQQLKESLELPLTGARVALDVMKLLKRLAPSVSPAAACEVESAMSLSLAAIASLRTYVELLLTQLAYKPTAMEVQEELRRMAQKAATLSDPIVTGARERAFGALAACR